MSAPATTATTGLSVRDLMAGYGEVPVVTGVDLDVRGGEIVTLLGRNGAGKSTTLLAIGGFLSRCAGKVTVDGQMLRGAPHRRMRGALGLVIEGRSVFPPLTTAQNLKLAEIDIDDALTLFPELRKCLRTKAGMLSGGEQQMLALARAMCRRPSVLLVDELSFGLAPIICERLFTQLRDFARDHRMAVLLVEQHLHYAELVGDRALVMREGRIALELPASDLASRADEIERHYLGGPELSHHDGETP